MTWAVEQGLRPVGIGSRLIADDLEADDAFLEHRVVKIGYARLNCVVETLEAHVCFDRPPFQFGAVPPAMLGLIVTTAEHIVIVRDRLARWPDRAVDGVVRWRPFDLQRVIGNPFLSH